MSTSTHWEEPAWAAEAREKRDYWEDKMDELEEDISLLQAVLEVIPVGNEDDSSWTNGGIAPEYEQKFKAIYKIRDICNARLEKKQTEYQYAENKYDFYVNWLMDL